MPMSSPLLMGKKMALHIVSPSSAIDMIGPYLAAKVTCPCCQLENVFLRSEGPTSAVKALSVCQHIRAHVVDDEGESKFEFEG